MNEKFFIYKSSYSTEEKQDLSFIPMMTRRKLSPLAKCAFSTIYNCYEGGEINLVFASRYGEFDKLKKLIEQYVNENEVSPITFSSSVHNAAIGTFSLLNNIKSKYNAVSAGENSLSNGLLEAILDEDTTLFCYADTLPESRSISCLIGKTPRPQTEQIELILKQNTSCGDEYEEFLRFLNKESNEYNAPFYSLRRVND